jgi:signal transduction histidine kinase
LKADPRSIRSCAVWAKCDALEAVTRTLKSTLLALSLACGLTSGYVRAQIGPQTDPTSPLIKADTTPPTGGGGTGGVVPKIFISGWSLNSEVAPTTLDKDTPVSLDPGNLELILFFGATPSSPPLSEFRYRLNDYDPDWTVTHERIVHYRRLSPGHYTFDVQARIPGQPWQVPTATIAVIQRPFFYQTWYFYLLVALGLVALSVQLLNQRDQLLKGQMGIVLEERNRIASDCHDTLMAGFAAISWQLEATAKLFQDADADTPAARSCELARSMVAHCQAEARRIIWDLRDSDELTDTLSLALSRAITTHRLRDSIETTFEVHGNEIPIAPGAVHHLVCIGQEAVTNAIRHADASTIKIALRFESDALSLSVRDNGCGFLASSTAIRAGHFGIPVMEERARKLGGVLRLNSAEGTGTEVAVTVSFQTINQPTRQQHHVVPWIGV